MKQKHTVLETDFHGLNLVKRGKVRDIYDLGDKLLMVVTDRISAFDVVMPDPLPGKGIILTQISLFWFDIMQTIIPNHVITADVDEYPEICRPYADSLRGRSMLVKKAVPLPVECIARGYISGSGWKSYKKSGDVCGIKLPPGLKESEKLPQPLFTPSTKADEGLHDINIEFKEAENLIGKSLAGQVRDLTLAIYEKGSKLAAGRGIITRFWPKAFYEPGGAQKSFDKQYLRDYLNSLAWDKTPPGPSLPQEIINKTRSKYFEALTLLTGSNHGL